MRSRPAHVMVFLFIAFSVLVQSSWAQGRTVSGSVKDAQGIPKRYVGVSFEGPRRYVGMTNGEGKYTIRDVMDGSYSVVVRQGDNVMKFLKSISGNNSELNLVVKW